MTFIWNTQKKWQDGVISLITALSCTQTNLMLYQQVLNTLTHIPWTGHLLGFENTIDMHQLVTFLNNDWLNDNHQLIMTNLLQETISPCLWGCVWVKNSFFMTMLIGAYENRASYGDTASLKWIQTCGQQLVAGQKSYLAIVVNIDNAHWVGLVLDFENHWILYRDSGGGHMPINIKNTVNWWTHYYTFTHNCLPITT